MLRHSLKQCIQMEPKPIREPHAKHFLLLHDAFKAVMPSIQIKANITQRRNFQTHMQIMWPGCTQYEVAHVLRDAQKQLTSGAFEPDLENWVATVTFYDDAALTLAFGEPNVTIDDVLKEPNNIRRQRLRASMGCNMPLYFSSLSAVTHNAANLCLREQERLFGAQHKEDIPPLFWVTYCEELINKYRQNEYVRVGFTASKEFLYYLPALPNPMLPEEDLNKLPCLMYHRSACQSNLIRAVASGEGLLHASEDSNPFGDGATLPTAEEWEKKMKERGWTEETTPHPRGMKPGFIRRLLGLA